MSARNAVLSATSALLLALAGCGGGGDGGAPASDAAKLVPADALVYVHVSTDTGRGATADALEAARRFPGFERLRDSIVGRLQAPGCRVPTGKGKEAALALLDAEAGTAGSLVIVDSGSDDAARDRTCGAVTVAKIGRFTVIGQPASIAAARRLAAGKGRALADQPTYEKGLAKLPDDRVLDAYVTADGVRRLLAPQSGLLGAVGLLLDQPGLRASSAALDLEGKDRARVVVASQLQRGTRTQTFTPELQDEIPDGAFAYVGTRGLRGVAARLLTQVPGGLDATALGRIFPGEVGVALTFAVPAPVMTLVAESRDPAAARRALGKVGLRTAIVDGKVVAATRQSGIDAVRSAKRHLPDTKAWDAVQPESPGKVTSLVFLDFSQLLRLAEQTGLNDSRDYLAVKRDLQRIRTVGARSSGGGDETTVEILLSIP